MPVKLDEYYFDIKQELEYVYITKDGKKFLNKNNAINHMKKIK